jgi:ABC-type Zn uptake system ZnuABC Zn-binding protein ZnuA
VPSTSLNPTATSVPGDDGVRPPTESALPLKVAVTLPLFEDFVREIGGNNVEVFSLIPAGVDPHGYELTLEDIRRIPEVDFFFVNGLGLDDHIVAQIEENQREDAKVIPFASNVRSPRASDLGDPNMSAEEAGDNMHLWLDPLLARIYAAIVADTFVIDDGINETFYDSNFATYSRDVLALDAETRTRLEGIPEENRKLVTHHDSLAMLASRYGLQVLGFLVATPGGEIEAGVAGELVAKVRAEGAPTVFAERGYDESVLADVASESGARLCTLATDIVDETARTYVEMMRANVDELVNCLGGGG